MVITCSTTRKASNESMLSRIPTGAVSCQLGPARRARDKQDPISVRQAFGRSLFQTKLLQRVLRSAEKKAVLPAGALAPAKPLNDKWSAVEDSAPCGAAAAGSAPQISAPVADMTAPLRVAAVDGEAGEPAAFDPAQRWPMSGFSVAGSASIWVVLRGDRKTLTSLVWFARTFGFGTGRPSQPIGM